VALEQHLRQSVLSQALLRELAAFNTGLCVITTRNPVADIADHEQTSVLRRELQPLSSDAGAKLLRALDIKGQEAELRSASDEFSGHCLALTLLGSYLSDAYKGDIRRCKEVSEHLAHDVRQGVHARKVMESYQTWFGNGAELAVLRMLGLFDRPADENAIGALLKPPAICGLTESLTDLSPSEWQMVLAKLRRARLLAGEDTKILEIWTHILLFVNTLANSSEVNEARRGRNVIGGSMTIIGRSRHSYRIVSGKWNHFSQPWSAAAMRVYFESRSMKFTFREFSVEMLTLRLTFLEREGRCSLF
jgi:hypothetical protein